MSLVSTELTYFFFFLFQVMMHIRMSSVASGSFENPIVIVDDELEPEAEDGSATPVPAFPMVAPWPVDANPLPAVVVVSEPRVSVVSSVPSSDPMPSSSSVSRLIVASSSGWPGPGYMSLSESSAASTFTSVYSSTVGSLPSTPSTQSV